MVLVSARVRIMIVVRVIISINISTEGMANHLLSVRLELLLRLEIVIKLDKMLGLGVRFGAQG